MMHDFLNQLFRNLATIGVDLDGYMIDHIAYRAESVEDGDAHKAEWLKSSKLLASAQVNGREVCIFQCDTPIVYESWSIPSLELMYPKPSKPYGGWDHIEVVLGPYTPSIDILRDRLLALFPDIARNAGDGYSYEEDGLHAIDQGEVLNPVITLRFTDKTAVRFHTADIREIIAMEG